MPQLAPSPSARQSKGRTALYLVILVCLAPVLASYYFYYLDPPSERTNHGTLILPLQEVQDLPVRVMERPQSESGLLDVLAQRSHRGEQGQDALVQGQAARLGSFRGRWVMVWVGPGPCQQDCLQTLVEMRQIRLTTGRDRDRVERLWLRVGDTQQGPLDPLPAGLEGTWVVSTSTDPRADWAEHLPVGQRATASQGAWLIDPQGHLMMHFPPEVEPVKIKKDLIRLLKASRIG